MVRPLVSLGPRLPKNAAAMGRALLDRARVPWRGRGACATLVASIGRASGGGLHGGS